MRKFDGDELLIATHNKGKVREISDLLLPYISKFYSASEFNLDEPEETGTTFAENAVLKAQLAAKTSGKVSLADDSGLAVNALGGDPGVYSARWGGQNKDFSLAMKKVHEALGDAKDRSAYFVCVLAIAWPDGHVEIFEGRVNGNIVWPMKGDKGFGYDPIFQADGYDITFAQMNPNEKHKISHRAKAFDLFVKKCLEG